ncbi:hypothetical protein DIPPA_03905 [Diplonema papillatum]|nr:hypothetical protein DIPPA_03905 [Diplonema papillatum]
MDRRRGYVAASATAKALKGVSVWQPAGTYMEGLRVATLAGLWTGGNSRCDAVVLNTLCRGHRLDPRVAAIHRRVNTFSQQMVKQSHLAPLVVAIRAARQARRDRPPGAPEAPGEARRGQFSCSSKRSRTSDGRGPDSTPCRKERAGGANGRWCRTSSR